MRRLLSALLTFVMVCSLVPAPALAEAADELAEGASEEEQLIPEVTVVEAESVPEEESELDSEGNGQESSINAKVVAAEENGIPAGVSAESDMVGTYTDAETGVVYNLQWRTDGLAIVGITLPEKDG